MANIISLAAAPTSNSGGSSPLAITLVTVGDFIVAMFKDTQTSSIQVNSVSGTGTGSWARIAGPFSITGSGNGSLDMWGGRVTAAGATTITPVWSGGSGDFFISQGIELTFSGVTGASPWTIDAVGTKQNTSSTTIAFPTLTPTILNDCYIGFSMSINAASATVTSGYTSLRDVDTNLDLYNANITVLTAQSPTGSQSPAGLSAAIACLISATPAVAGIIATRRGSRAALVNASTV